MISGERAGWGSQLTGSASNLPTTTKSAPSAHVFPSPRSVPPPRSECVVAHVPSPVTCLEWGRSTGVTQDSFVFSTWSGSVHLCSFGPVPLFEVPKDDFVQSTLVFQLPSPVISLCHPTSSRVLAGDTEGRLTVGDGVRSSESSERNIRVVTKHQAPIRAIASLEPDVFVSASWDRQVYVTDLRVQPSSSDDRGQRVMFLNRRLTGVPRGIAGGKIGTPHLGYSYQSSNGLVAIGVEIPQSESRFGFELNLWDRRMGERRRSRAPGESMWSVCHFEFPSQDCVRSFRGGLTSESGLSWTLAVGTMAGRACYVTNLRPSDRRSHSPRFRICSVGDVPAGEKSHVYGINDADFAYVGGREFLSFARGDGLLGVCDIRARRCRWFRPSSLARLPISCGCFSRQGVGERKWFAYARSEDFARGLPAKTPESEVRMFGFTPSLILPESDVE